MKDYGIWNFCAWEAKKLKAFVETDQSLFKMHYPRHLDISEGILPS